MIRLGGELAAALKTGLAVGRQHVSLVALEESLAETHGAYVAAVKCVYWELGGAEGRSIREVKQSQVRIVERLPVDERRLDAYLKAIGALLDETAAPTLERCTPADFFDSRLLDDPALTTPEHFLEALKRRSGPDTWASWYDDDVRTGGHRLYFSNTHCRFWREVLPRLDTRKTQVLAEAVALFGEKGPADELAARREQLLAFTSEQQRALAALDERYRSARTGTIVP